jgi:ribonuclease J
MIKTTDGAGRPGHHPRVAPRSAPKHDRIDRLIDTATATAVAAMPTHPATHAGATSKYTASRQNLRVIPLGGVEEVGCNMTMFEYGDDIVIVDMGFAFPDETTPGIDYIIPDTKYLEDNKKKIRGILLTHGHLDHIGAIPYILPKIGDPPIYTLQLTAGFVKKRLEEFDMVSRARINVVTKDDTLQLGAFKIRFFLVNHSIPDGVGISLSTPVGQVIHTGDWKLDHTPVNEKPAELHKLAQFGTEGVLLLMSDSTNSAKPGYCLSEKDLGVTLDRVFSDAKQRVVFASFSSLISRMQQVLDISAKYNRKVVVTGRSMVNNVEIALSLGYLKINKGQIIKSEQASKYPDNQITILTTGAQGEEASALARMARGEHKTVRIKRGDTVIVSASPIPGNERAIVSVLDNLTREGANVIYNKIYDIHTSGHAQQEELKLMMALTKPRYFMPIHGEHHMLVAHGKLANTVGIGEDRVKILNNGSILEINSAGEAKIIDDKIPSGYVFIDGLGIGDVGEVVLRDRQVMANDGMFVIIVTLDRRSGKLINQPDIISRGFIYMKNNDELVREVKHEVRKLTESGGKTKLEPNWAFLRQQIRDSVGEYLFQKTQRRPMILPVVIEI